MACFRKRKCSLENRHSKIKFYASNVLAKYTDKRVYLMKIQLSFK